MSIGAAKLALARDLEGDQPDATILVVESSASVGGELVEQLRADRYNAVLARSTQHARALARAQPLRAIVLGSLDAPRDALELLGQIRRPAHERSDGAIWDERVPVIVSSPGSGQLELLRAFEMGADDFVARTDREEGWSGPSYLELRVRLKSLLRRAERPARTRRLQVGSLEIDTSAHVVRFAGAPIELRRLEYELLVHLARNPTGVHSKQELLLAIWHRHAVSGARTVDSHASRLRRKLDAAGAHGFVVNVWGVGYRLV